MREEDSRFFCFYRSICSQCCCVCDSFVLFRNTAVYDRLLVITLILILAYKERGIFLFSTFLEMLFLLLSSVLPRHQAVKLVEAILTSTSQSICDCSCVIVVLTFPFAVATSMICHNIESTCVIIIIVRIPAN